MAAIQVVSEEPGELQCDDDAAIVALLPREPTLSIRSQCKTQCAARSHVQKRPERGQ
jgi:hypothetical protein